MTELWAHTILASFILVVFSIMLWVLFDIIDDLIEKGDDDEDDDG